MDDTFTMAKKNDNGSKIKLARCYKGFFNDKITKTYGDVKDNVLRAAHSAAKHTLMDSLGTHVKSHLTPYDTVLKLYLQLVTQYSASYSSCSAATYTGTNGLMTHFPLDGQGGSNQVARSSQGAPTIMQNNKIFEAAPWDF
ncbi:hypothetical protein OIV83_006530 [Microbotryomycetes sp. JL201]|nr:hypothetical protein OIV83_006530 [Microbotryomycetes sp. JL201]